MRNYNSSVATAGGPILTLEEHLARFIAVAKAQYNIEVEAVIPGGTNAMTNGNNAYDFTLVNSTFLQNMDEFANGDPCLNPADKTSGKMASTEASDWIYFDETIHGTVYPIDEEGNFHPFDEIRRGIWNVRVFNSKNEELKTALASSLEGFTEWQPICLGFDRVIPEWEFWDEHFAELTGDSYVVANTSVKQPIYKINDAWDGLLTLLEYAKCSSGLLNECGFAVDTWINNFSSYADNGNQYPAYLMYDNNNVIIDPYTSNINTNMAKRIESLADNIYVAAFKNTPCKSFYSGGTSTQRTFQYKLTQFHASSILSKIIPTFKSKNEGNNSLYHFLKQRTDSGAIFNGTFGKAETVFYKEFLASALQYGWNDSLNGYSWYNRAEPFSNLFYKTNLDTKKESKGARVVFFFYPNPSHTRVTIETNQLGEQIIVRNITGQVVYQSRIETYKYDLPLNQFTAGMYFMQVGDLVKKLIVN